MFSSPSDATRLSKSLISCSLSSRNLAYYNYAGYIVATSIGQINPTTLTELAQR